MTKEKIPVIAIIGPTAVGKTEFSLSLAKELNAEVISVDSRQGLPLSRRRDGQGSRARVRREIIHHLIDIADPDEIYSAADFAQDADGAARRIIAPRARASAHRRHALFITARYRARSRRIFRRTGAVRAQLAAEIEERGLAALHDELLEIDPEAGARIHPNDPVRTMRALEIFRITGRNASWWYKKQQKMVSPYDIFYIGLTRLRANLYQNIERRVKEQFASGYPEEVEWLLKNGYSPSLPALQGFGYRELVDYLAGRCTFLEAIEGRHTLDEGPSRAARRTWFKHFEPAVWFDFDEISKAEALRRAVPLCLAHLNGERAQ